MMIYVTTIKPLTDHDHDHNDDERGDDGDDDDKIAMMTSESMIDHGKLVVCGLRLKVGRYRQSSHFSRGWSW